MQRLAIYNIAHACYSLASKYLPHIFVQDREAIQFEAQRLAVGPKGGKYALASVIAYNCTAALVTGRLRVRKPRPVDRRAAVSCAV